jgi:oxygen-independent coproporphyrinogen-3 oxidase
VLLYIHIPFCDSKCHYCAFNSSTIFHYLRDDYVKALCKQLKFELNNIGKNKLKTVFIGGGTPSTIGDKGYKDIFKILTPYITNIKEITCEANPNSGTYNWLENIYKLGVNRISFGVQSFNEKKLKFLNRKHTANMAIHAIQNAKNIGFKHINCDIIYDTVLDTKELIDYDLNMIQTLPVDHVSAYSLTLEEGTKFYNKSNVRVENIDMAKYIFNTLKKNGFYQYEISNFAKKKDAQSKHNLGYWRYEQYLGLGAGAVGYIDNKRLYNEKDINLYINNPIDYANIEKLSDEDVKVEKVLLGLRCNIGVKKNILNDKELKQAYNLVKLDKLQLIDKNIFHSLDFLLADELALYIME